MTAEQTNPDLQMTPDQVRQWWTRVELAEAAAKPHHEKWDKLLDAYLPSKDADAINANAHFRNTEQKKAQLFLKNPELRLSALEPLQSPMMDPRTEQPLADQNGQPVTADDAVAIHAAVLNKKLGRDGVNVARLMRSLLFDALQCSGLAVSLIAYETDTVPVETAAPGPEQPIEGSVLGLSTVPSQKMITVDVPVFEDWTWERMSPKKLLIPHDFHGTDFDKAPWLGYKFVKTLAQAKRDYALEDDFKPNATVDEALLKASSHETGRGVEGKSELVEGVVIYYRPSFFEGTIAHRQVQYCLVLLRGLKDRPVKHRLSPYQTINQRGGLTVDSLTTYPIRVLALRELSDSAYVPADAAFTDPLIKQKNTWRAQDIKIRDSNIPRFLYDESIKDALEALKNADVGEGAPVPQGSLMNGIEKLIAELPKLEKAMADIDGQRAIDRDISETLALGANQAGTENDKVISATEVAAMQNSSGARLDAERDVLIEYFLDGVRVYDTLLQRYATEDDYVEIVGSDGSKRLAKWNKQVIAGKYAYDIRPESQLRVDAGQDQKRINDFMNFHAKNPNIDLAELTKIAAQKFGLDPSKLVRPPEPPGPPAPNVSVRVTMDDLAGPAGPIALKVMQQAGYQVTDQDLATVQANGVALASQEAAAQAVASEHGGPSDKADLLNKHNEQETGRLNNAPAAAGVM